MQNFGTAKFVLSVVVLIGWLIVAFSAFFGIFTWAEFGPMGIPFVFGSFMSGLFLVVTAQFGYAQIATAENTAAIKDLLMAQSGSPMPSASTKSSGQSSGPGRTTKTNPSRAAPSLVTPGRLIKNYKGYQIIKEQDGVSVAGQVFDNVLEAEKWVRDQVKQSTDA